MSFDPALFALVTFGLLLNAGTLDEVRDAWALQGSRLAVFIGQRSVAAATGQSDEAHHQE